MAAIQFLQTSPEQFQKDLSDCVKAHLDDFLKHFKPKQPHEYLTRQETADLLRVDLSTIWNWQKSGKLKPLGIGGRVYFRRADIEQSLQPLSEDQH